MNRECTWEPGLADGHFNVLRGVLGTADNAAGVKIVGDFVDNYKSGMPSEFGVLLLFDPRNGVPRAIMDASGNTDMRTGAVTAIGAKYLARKNSKILGHVGARGTAYWNVRLLDHLFDFDEIRVQPGCLRLLARQNTGADQGSRRRRDARSDGAVSPLRNQAAVP